MLKKYLLCFLVSMVPLIELRGGVPIAIGMGLDYFEALVVCVIGNMLPVPIIYFLPEKYWSGEKTSGTSESSSPSALKKASVADKS